MPVSIKALQYFLLAAEQRSIAKAAERLNVVPSAVSSAIELVEEAFGMQLVQRYPAKGISPTAAGIAMMRKIRRLIEEYDTLLLEGAELRTALSGSVSIGYYAPVAPAFMPSIVEPLLRQHPDVTLRLVETDNEAVQAGLLDGAFDLILFVAENVRTGIVCRTLIEAPPYVLVPVGHAFSGRPFVTAADLRGEPLVLLDLPMTSQYYRSLVSESGQAAHVVATATTHEMVRSLVGAGVGCSILNMLPSTEITYGGDRVTAVPLQTASSPLQLVLGQLGGKPRRLVKALADAIEDTFAGGDANTLIVSGHNA